MADQLQFEAGHYRLTRGADMDDRDPTALLVAAAAAGDEYAWHETVDRCAAAPARHRELLRLLMADPPLRYAQISRRPEIPAGRIGPAPAKVPVASGASACDHARERWRA
jgi:hypothetical protein